MPNHLKDQNLKNMRELLKKYKNGTLTAPDEQDAFMHELLQIRAQKVVQTQTAVISNELPKKGILIQLNTFLRKVDTSKYCAAAACILLTCFTFWKFSTTSIEPNNNLLLADIVTVSENLKGAEGSVRGNAMRENKVLISVNNLYEDKDFQGIINELEGKSLNNENEYLYLGLAYINLKTPNFSKALECFGKIQSAGYKQGVTMIRAICYIGLDNKDAAREILNQIINDVQQGNEYKNKAIRLLKGL